MSVTFKNFLLLSILLLMRACFIEATTQTATGSGLYQGDIILTDPQRHLIESLSNKDYTPNAPQQAVAKVELRKWTNGTVPYILDHTLTLQMTRAVKEAITDYENYTCIKFVPKTNNHFDYIRFTYGHSCSSLIGRVGGEQKIYIGVDCSKKGVVIHEIFHALGRWHEHSRPDRDQHVTINYNSITKGYERDFERANSIFVTTQGIPYDFDSLLHYDAYAFTSNGQPTLKPKNKNIALSRLGQRKRFSENDLLHVKSLYCPDGKGQWSSWSTWSSCSRTCNGGVQSRTRICVGGVDCSGRNIGEQHCGMIACTTLPVWSSWSEWSSCSSTCGSGRRSRLRRCINGTMCTNGTSHEFEDCYLKNCPEAPVWYHWGSWSSCSQTCQGGVRYRTRRCKNGSDKDCSGPPTENQFCNTNTLCSKGTTWSSCSKSCGSGVQFRMIKENGTLISRVCNTQPCHNEYCLKGIKHEGCYNRNENIISLETSHPLLMDSPGTRRDPVTKCAQVAYANHYKHFAISLGACYTTQERSNNHTNITSYQSTGVSSDCRNGLGGNATITTSNNHTMATRNDSANNSLVMDVYTIVNKDNFINSITGIGNCGRDYCIINNGLDCSVPSSSSPSISHYNYYYILLLLLLSIISLIIVY